MAAGSPNQMKMKGAKTMQEEWSIPAARRMKRIGEKVALWFTHSKRSLPWREEYHPYQVWISEIMLQQTRVEAVLPYFRRWMARFPDVQALASAREGSVLKAWEGLGYYSRARNLRKAARSIVKNHGGMVPDDVRDLESLPGIGRYTAGAVASIAYGRRAPAVDGNAGRVLSRLEALELPARSSEGGKRLWGLASSLVLHGNPRLVNEGLMELGALVCLPRNPRCAECPLRQSCFGHRSGHPERFPSPAPRKARPVRRGVLLLARDSKGRTLFRKRPSRGLWGGLWEPPWEELEKDRVDGVREGTAGPDVGQHEVERQVAGLGLRGDQVLHLGTLRHGLTHFELVLECFRVRVSGNGKGVLPEHRWVDGKEAASLPLARFGRRALEMEEAGK